MKKILLSLLISAPLCAMQPEQKTQVGKNVQRVATGISVYNAVKPMEMGLGCILPQPTLWPLATAVVVYGGTKFAMDMYQKTYLNQERNK